MMNVVAPSRETWLHGLAYKAALVACQAVWQYHSLICWSKFSLDWPKLLNARRGKALGCFIQCVSGEGKKVLNIDVRVQTSSVQVQPTYCLMSKNIHWTSLLTWELWRYWGVCYHIFHRATEAYSSRTRVYATIPANIRQGQMWKRLFGHGKRFLVQVPWFETTLAGKVWKVFKKCGLVVSMAAFFVWYEASILWQSSIFGHPPEHGSPFATHSQWSARSSLWLRRKKCCACKQLYAEEMTNWLHHSFNICCINSSFRIIEYFWWKLDTEYTGKTTIVS